MKKIVSILLSVAAMLMLAPHSGAQNDKLYYKDNGNGLAYSKTISQPDQNGVYTITLESFVTGAVTVKDEDAPADIILVLDVSGSMTWPKGEATQTTKTTFSYNDIVNGEVDYFRTFEGYTEQIYGELYNGRYYLYVSPDTKNNNRAGYYLTADGDITDSRNNAASSSSPDDVIVTPSTGHYERQWVGSGWNAHWEDVWVEGGGNDQYFFQGTSRIHALKDAVEVFIEEIDKNDANFTDENGNILGPRDGRLGNRIAIVKFASDKNDNPTPTEYYVNRSDRTYNYSQIVRQLTDVENNVETLKADVKSFVARGDTQAGYGMSYANTILSGIDAYNTAHKRVSSKTVVMFTDGEPKDNYAAIAQAYVAKNTYKAKVYTVGVFTTSPSETGNYDSQRMWRYMNYVSSNYPNASGINTAGDDGDSNAGYYRDASGNASLTDIFKQIAQASGGSSYTGMTEAAATVDVVSASFMLPDGATEESIEIYTSPVVGIMKTPDGQRDTTYTVTVDGEEVERHWLKFGTEYLKPTNPQTYTKPDDDTEYPVDDNITVTLSKSGSSKKDNVITVNNFDYANNWCGVDESSPTGYHGHKLIIKIPIMMDPSAVGGPHVATNADGSGIFVNGQMDKPAVKFESPKVSLPVNLHINKQGLDTGESAKFNVLRSNDGGSHWTEVTSVFVTRHSGQETDEPLTKIQGLPSTDENGKEYVYKIVEDDWSWSYTGTAVGGIDRSDQLVTNPFIFTNQKISTDIDIEVRHAESKATNTFKNGNFVVNNKVVKKVNENHVGYDDSKNNNREVITIENSTAGGTE